MVAEAGAARLVALSRIQLLVTGAVLAFLALSTGVLDLMAHSGRLAHLLMRLDQQANRKDKNRYSYERLFPDFEDRLINEELRSADYSRGGVYLIGTSTLKWATRMWELPADQQRVAFNYGIGATDHGQQF